MLQKHVVEESAALNVLHLEFGSQPSAMQEQQLAEFVGLPRGEPIGKDVEPMLNVARAWAIGRLAKGTQVAVACSETL